MRLFIIKLLTWQILVDIRNFQSKNTFKMLSYEEIEAVSGKNR